MGTFIVVTTNRKVLSSLQRLPLRSDTNLIMHKTRLFQATNITVKSFSILTVGTYRKIFKKLSVHKYYISLYLSMCYKCLFCRRY